jgi:cyclic lactone autoinducer peptide
MRKLILLLFIAASAAVASCSSYYGEPEEPDVNTRAARATAPNPLGHIPRYSEGRLGGDYPSR